MSTGRLNFHPRMIPHVLQERLWGDRDFFLLDVGASGGIEPHWRVFDPRLAAVGFDPLLAEVARLNEREKGSRISYEACFVTCRNYDELFPPELRADRIRSRNNDPFQRVSAIRAQELLRINYTEEMFNSGAPAVYTDRHIVLDEFIEPRRQSAVDFIKVDTDGHDFPVLLGSEGLLRAGGVLGFSVEAQFHGAAHDYANTFANIDRFLRGHGFSLFDIDVYRYSRAALPAPFVYDIPAQTLTGQVLWGEAVYFRDLANTDYERTWEYEATAERVLKLACLFELFGLPDCAAELLLARRSLVGPESEPLLDILAQPGSGAAGAYRQYIQAFEADVPAFYPRRRRKVGESDSPTPAAVAPGTADIDASPSGEPPPPAPAGENTAAASGISEQSIAAVDRVDAARSESSELERLRARVRILKEKKSKLKARLHRRDEEIQRLSAELAHARTQSR